jgi:uncharacterized Zn-finger protein
MKFKCDECEYYAWSEKALAEHIRVHTGEKPYQCMVHGCDYTLKQVGNLTYHMEHWHQVDSKLFSRNLGIPMRDIIFF